MSAVEASVWAEFDTRPAPPRDQWGRYRLPHPETGKAQSWTRATTLAATLADKFGLTNWKRRMVAIGLTQRPDLLIAASAAAGDNKALDRICDEAAEAAGASAGANKGTALHTLTEQVDLGLDPHIPAPWNADIDAYRATLEAAGVVINREWLERVVVNPAITTAGTFDRIVTIGDKRYIADLKTGGFLPFGEIAIQLAIYATATHMWAGEDRYEPMPEVERDRALVIHLPAEQATCTLLWVDIAKGAQAIKLAVATRDWRKQTDRKDSAVVTPFTPPMDPRRANLTGRIATLDDAGKAMLAQYWPAGVPTFRQAIAHTARQYDAIEAVLVDVEREVEAPFNPPPRESHPLAELGLVAEARQRIVALPADLAQTLAEQLNGRIPAMSTGLVNTRHMELLTAALAPLEQVVADRKGVAELMLNDCFDMQAERDAVLAVVGDLTWSQSDLERLTVVIEAFTAGYVDADSATEAGDGFIQVRYGGKRGATAAAKAWASRLGRPAPKSYGDVLSSPLIASFVACGPDVAEPNNQPSEEEQQ